MPKIELISSDEDDDIWDYRSQTQKTRKTMSDVSSKNSAANELLSKKQSAKSKSLGKSRSGLSQKQVKVEDEDSQTAKPQKQKKITQKKKTKVKVEMKKESTPNGKQDVDRSGRCPVCQMPFALLSMIETPSWHVDVCLDVPSSGKNECPAGLECDSQFASHYKKFKHVQIARSRRKNEISDRDTGNVDSARTRLSFDANGNDKRLIVPGSSADCVIDLDTSQDSNYSQRLNDVQEEDLPSLADEIDGEQMYLDKISSTKLEKSHSSKFPKISNGINRNYEPVETVETKMRSGEEKGKEKVIGMDKNFLTRGFKHHFDRDNLKTNPGRVECRNLNDDEDYELEEMNSIEKNADVSAGLTRVEVIDLSDDSCGSVQDIDDLVDETRSLSDMINDALAHDDEVGTEDSEIDSNKVDVNKKYEFRGETKSNSNTTDNTEIETDATDDDEEEEDDLISLFTDRTKKTREDRIEKESAISHLRETPAKLTDSNSSSDWEILKTTLTQPSFELSDMRKDINTESVIEKDSGQLYKASLKTPTKDLETSSARQHKEKTPTAETCHIFATEKDKIPQRGFFATKMLQNVCKSKPMKSNINSFTHREENDDKETGGEDKLPIKQLKERKTLEKNVSQIQKNKEICPKSKHPQLKGNCCTETDQLKNDVDRFMPTYSSPGKRRYPNEKHKSATSDVKFAKLENSTLLMEEVEIPENIEKRLKIKFNPKATEGVEKLEPIEKKPKIELKTKTPTKRKLSKNRQKQTIKKENKDRIYPKLDSFFKHKGETKNKQISIQTDSESSGDCERFNKIGKIVKCCEKCTEGKSCTSNYSNCMDKEVNVSNQGDNNSNLINRSKAKCSSVTNSISKPNQNTCDSTSGLGSTSEATSSKSFGSSQNSLNVTVSGSCHSCSEIREGKAQSRNIRNNASQQSSQQSQGQSSFDQGQSCSQLCQGHSCSHQCSSSQHGHCSGIQKRNNSYCKSQSNSLSNSTCSQNTLQFNIENVCTLSQNTYGNLGGGFVLETEDNVSDPLNNPQCASHVTCHIPCANSMEHMENSEVSVPDQEVKSILQIRKSATEILMASSRLLYNKSTKSNASASGGQKSATENVRNSVGGDLPSGAKKTLEKVNQRGRGWNRNQGSTSTETSDDTNDVKRKCPFYKKIPDTCMTVDAFRYGNIPDCRAYILSHFHYDHYMGLRKQFKNPIYCSKITGNLVKKKIGVDSQYIHTIPLSTPTVVENVEITFLEANHCPGAVLILFKLKSGKVYLHTGDFRANQAMELYPPLQNLRIHSLYLDTTYCDPQYDFPPQEEVIQFTVNLALNALANNPKTLIVCGTYTIGKERIFTAIAEELDCKICVTRDKKTVMDCMEDEKLKQRVSLNWADSCLHVVPMNKINYNGLQEHLLLNGKKYNSVLGIEPTGWTHSKKTLSLFHIKPKVNKDNIKIYGVPYSEHSSFLEMKTFVQFTKPAKILPTVNNGNVHSRKKMEVIFEAWMEDSHTNRGPVSRQSSITGWTQ